MLLQLTDFQPMFHFYTPLKTSENLGFSDVFRGYKSQTLVENGLILNSYQVSITLNWNQSIEKKVFLKI